MNWEIVVVSCISQVLYSTAFISIVFFFYHYRIITTWLPMRINNYYETSELKIYPKRPSFPHTCKTKGTSKMKCQQGCSGYTVHVFQNCIGKSILTTMIEICHIYLSIILCPHATFHLINGNKTGKL